MKPLVLAGIALASIAGCASVNPQTPALVEYQRSGGIAGFQDRLVVHTDGTVELHRRAGISRFTVGSDTLARLRSLLKEIRFDGLRAEYLPSRPIPDAFEYLVVYGNRRVRTMDTAVPSEMQPLLDFLNTLLVPRG